MLYFKLEFYLFRFFVNPNQFIVTIGRKSTLVDTHEIEYHILWQLIMQKELYTLFIYFLGLYNEDNDTFSYLALIMVI